MEQQRNVCFVLVLTLTTVHLISGSTLYTEPDSKVINLDSSNFTSAVIQSNFAWILDFYAVWCGHCQRLAPVWKAFAKDIKDWDGVIKVAAIACSDQSNSDICREYHIHGYPSIRFLPPYTSAGYDGQPYRGKGTVEELREGSVSFLEGLREKPSGWPKLGNTLSLANHNALVAQGKVVFILFEDVQDPDYEPYTGREVVLDFSSQQSAFTIVRMNKTAAANVNIRSLPALYQLMPNTRLHKIAEKQDREGFGTAIKQAMQRLRHAAGRTTLPPTTTPGVTTSTAGSTTQMWTPTIGVYMQDLEAGLYYSLWTEVGTHRNMRGPVLEALKEYVHTLAKYFPGSPNVRNFLQRVDAWLQRKRGSLTGAQWRRKLQRLTTDSAFIPSSLIWRSCTGSKAHYRGYPCALWTIFHTLTVAAYDKHSADENFDPKEVLYAIGDYVHGFLGCRHCAEHFGQMARSIVNVTDSKDVIMWLWRAHNKVNKRLAGDITEDQRHPKIQFPTLWMCPTCRSGVDPGTQEIIWNESEILAFLRRFYGEHYIIRTPWNPDVTTIPYEKPTPAYSVTPSHSENSWKLRTAPPPVTLQRLTPDRQGGVLALNRPDIRVHNRGQNNAAHQTGHTTPRWVAPIDQRGRHPPDRSGRNPFSPDFPQRGRYFDPHANKPDHNSQQGVDVTAAGGQSRLHHTTTTTSLPNVQPTLTPPLTFNVTLHRWYARRNTRRPNTNRYAENNHRYFTTARPPYNQQPPTPRPGTQYSMTQRPHTQFPGVNNHHQVAGKTYPPRSTNYFDSQNRGNYPTPRPYQDQNTTPRPGYHRFTQRQYDNRYNTPSPNNRQPRTTQRPYYHQRQTQRPHQPQHATQRPYSYNRHNYATERPYYPQRQTQRLQQPQYVTQRPHNQNRHIERHSQRQHRPQRQTQSPYYRPYPYTPRPQYPQYGHKQTSRPHFQTYRQQAVTARPHNSHVNHNGNGLISHVYSHSHKPSKPVSTAIGRPRNCTLQSTRWSQCSTSCGTGMSTRFSNDNQRCRMEMEMRVCKLRPCNMAFREHVRPGSCGATFRAVWQEPIQYGSCSSLVTRKWHYCGSCPGKCCRPVVEDTNWMTFTCKNGEMKHSKFMFIRLCRCLPGRC